MSSSRALAFLLLAALGCGTGASDNLGAAEAQATAERDVCAALLQQARVSFPAGTPDLAPAGTTVEFAVHLSVPEPTILTGFDPLMVVVGLSNGLSGSLGFSNYFFVETAESDFVFRKALPPNVMGPYTVTASVGQRDASGKPCFGSIPSDAVAPIVVTNDPAKVDLLAPIVTSVELEQEYRLGECVDLTFTAVDASPICTVERVATNECSTPSWHIALVDVNDPKHKVDPQPDTRVDGAGRLVTSFELTPNEFASGDYRIEGINVTDIWGNKAADLPRSLQRVFSVK